MVAAWHFDLSSHAEQSFYCYGADDGRVVLNLMKISRIRLYLASIFSSVSMSLKYNSLSTALTAESVDGIVLQSKKSSSASRFVSREHGEESEIDSQLWTLWMKSS